MSVVPASFNHDDCRALQMALNEKCRAALYVDGDIGAKTVSVLKSFQVLSNLATTGEFDEKTSAILLPFMRAKYLKHEDYVQAATQLQCELAVVYAAVEVEAGGDGFLPDGRCAILFERHKFYQAIEKKYGAMRAQELQSQHPTICNKQSGGYSGGAKEWDRINVAAAIDHECANASASWGMFQVMGFNYQLAGWSSVQDFTAAMQASEANQLKAFVNFIKADPKLWTALRSRDWASYARLYNGPTYAVNHYDTKMATAFARFNGKV